MGLSLDQIRRFIKDDISTEEIQGMLLMKKAELEQQVLDELKRIRTIESRLKQIKDRATHMRDVVVKQVPQQRLIGIRKVLPNGDSGDDFFWSVMNALPEGNDRTYGAMTENIGIHGDGVASDRTDVELGRLLHKTDHAPLTTYDGMTLGTRSLPPATMATFVPPTSSCAKLLGYNAIGRSLALRDRRMGYKKPSQICPAFAAVRG